MRLPNHVWADSCSQPSDFEALADAVRSLWQGLVPLQIGVMAESPDLIHELRAQLNAALPRGYRAELHELRTHAEAFALGALGHCRFHVVVLDRGCAERFDRWSYFEAEAPVPEVILLDVSCLVADQFRSRGIIVSKEMRGAWSCEGLTQEVLCAGLARFALRLLARNLVGCMPLRDALHVLRHSMVASALAETKTRSKSSAARRLGVTRPAIQSIARAMALDVALARAVVTN